MTYDPNPAYGQENRRSGPRWYSVVAFFVIAALLTLITLGVLTSADADERIAETNERMERLAEISTCVEIAVAATGEEVPGGATLRVMVLDNCFDDEKRMPTIFDN